MAISTSNSLIGKTPAETFKDLLTVASSTPNQGLESTAKRVFDGEGIGSPLYIGTSSLDIIGTTSITGTVGITGATTITGDLTVTGNIINSGLADGDATFDEPVIATGFSLVNSSNVTIPVMSMASSTTVQIIPNLVTKGSMTFLDGTNEMRIDAANGGLQKGDGTKGKVQMKDTEVSLNKGSKELFLAKEDGTGRFQTVSTLPSNPNGGDIVNKDGEIFIAT
tara:strand:+ start:1609 stop:2277 length:669 start_codon:yes stop_codon:yes gene_type:complete